jgi:hypothetical protein
MRTGGPVLLAAIGRPEAMTTMYDVEPALECDPARPAPAPPVLDRRLVHKSFDENVLLSHIEAVPESGATEEGDLQKAPCRRDHFEGRLCVQRGHRFFFEHPRDHVPGLYLIEAGRQMSVAVAHMFYGVPFGTEFVMTDLTVEFRNMANIHDPLTAHNVMSRHVYRKGQLMSMHSSGAIRQGGLDVARMAGTMVLMDPNLLKRLERRGGKA